MKFTGITFGPDDRVVLDDNEFVECKFIGAHLVYFGRGNVTMDSCDFDEPVMCFEEEASNTFQFLSAYCRIRGNEKFADIVAAQLLNRYVPSNSPTQFH
jgi:hypothetical protein